MDLVPLDIAFVVLHTSPLHQPGTKDAGGMNVVVLAQAEELAREGHRVRMITRRNDAGQAAIVELAPRLSVVHLDAGPARLLAKGDHEALIGAFGEALLAYLRVDPTQILHAEHWYSGVAALPVARELGIPILQSYHSIAAAEDTPLTEGERPEAPGRLPGERMLAHEVDAVVTVSEAERSTVLERLGGDPLRVHVVAPGVDTELFRPHNPGEARQSHEPRVGLASAGADSVADPSARKAEAFIAGRLHPLKGFDVAIAAIAAIPHEKRPILRIVGSPPPDGATYVQGLLDAVAAANMEDSVIFEDALTREEFAERIRNASVVLIPSHSETYGLVALEAAASGVPVIARATGGLLEAVEDGVTGILVGAHAGDTDTDTDGDADADDIEAWTHAIEDLLSHPALAERMRIDARMSALRRNWKASTARLLEVYRELL